MPKGIFKRQFHTEETKKKMSKAHIGIEPWNKGKGGYKTKPCSEERKRKIGLANSIALKGKIQSIETRIKKSIALRGKKNHQWQGGKTSKSQQIRRGIELRLWREAVFARDNWTCQRCYQRGGKLEAHHIKSFAKYPELRFAIDNGKTLCIKCHKKTSTYLNFSNLKAEELVPPAPAPNPQAAPIAAPVG